ncbi:MAG: hypothetical protein KBT44_00025 [Bacteroidales bacterium]|nr:hypothetical protein [Candidatus Equibacterium intestinale]
MNSKKERLFPYDSPQSELIGIEVAGVLAQSLGAADGSTEDYLTNDEKWW